MKDIKYIAIAILLGAGVWFFKSWQHRGQELERNKANYENVLQEKESNFSEYKFKKEKEFDAYLEATDNQLSGLKKQLEQTNIRINRVTKIVSTNLNSRDTIINNFNIDSLLQKVTEKRAFIFPFTDVSGCFENKGNFTFDGVKGSVNITDRKYTDTLNYIYHWHRKKHRWLFGIKTGLFGKKILEDTLLTKCGSNIKTIVIEK